jgi:D-lactate dehydrogenase (cytochrome)/glycolate oxidase
LSRTQLSAGRRKFLSDLFPGDDALFGAEETCIYGTDASRLEAPPSAVVRPREERQMAELLAWSQRERVPIFPRARATNLVGGCVPEGGGVVVSTLLMNRIREISGTDFVCVTEPGAVTGDLQAAVEAEGLFYPPDPASLRISTIGGNVSTNAGGMRALKYGVTKDFVLGLRAVLPGGEVIVCGGRNHKNVVGLDLTRLLVGSEGTLALLSEITLKLLPLPEATASLLAGFADMERAVSAAGKVFAAGILPTALEFMAGEAIMAVSMVEKNVPWKQDTGACLLLRLDGSRESLRVELERLARVLAESEASFMERGLGPEEEEPLWELRRLINPASYRLGPDKVSDDIAVPRGRVSEALSGIRAVGEEHGLPVLTFGHLGDGNIHVNIMHDRKNQAEAAHRAMERIIDLTLELGGTVSGEHGVGLMKQPWFDRQVGARERELMRRMKSVFDPRGIMNPGKGY